ncbi:MAG: rod shape-determining protein MreC [Dethiobacter sp.]|nr:rod shape-determining protein MreC [Dethiobacter sp.]
MLTPIKIRKKPVSILLIFVFLLILASFTSQGRQKITLMEEMLLTVVAPVQGVFQRLTFSAESVFASVREYQLLLKENALLHEQLAASSTLEAQLAELRKENHRLRQMLDLREKSEYQLIASEVIARDASNWFQTMTINRGSMHGVKKNMAVVTSEGLVGSIYSVSHISSQVLLLTDSRPAVSAFVQRSREPGQVGVVESAPGIPGYLRMINLPREANIQPGDIVISSGLGEIFPKGLVIGHVLETGEDEYGILQYALLRPAANFNRLEEVFVVIPVTEKRE